MSRDFLNTLTFEQKQRLKQWTFKNPGKATDQELFGEMKDYVPEFLQECDEKDANLKGDYFVKTMILNSEIQKMLPENLRLPTDWQHEMVYYAIRSLQKTDPTFKRYHDINEIYMKLLPELVIRHQDTLKRIQGL